MCRLLLFDLQKLFRSSARLLMVGRGVGIGHGPNSGLGRWAAVARDRWQSVGGTVVSPVGRLMLTVASSSPILWFQCCRPEEGGDGLSDLEGAQGWGWLGG
jgi:hypothetical protein